MKKYKILTGTPIDSNNDLAYWIEITEKYLFNLFTRRKVIGNYTITTDYDTYGDMPFFSYEAAKERLEQLKTVFGDGN